MRPPHDDDIFFSQFNVVAVQAVMLGIFAQRRKDALLLPFQLNTQHHYDIGVNDSIFQICKYVHSHLFDIAGQHGSRPCQNNLGAHLG